MSKIIFTLCIFCTFHLQSQNTFIVKSNEGNETHRIYMLQEGTEPSLEFQFEFTADKCYDIAISPEGKFYGVGKEEIYEIYPNEGTVNSLFTLSNSQRSNNLVCSNDNMLYCLTGTRQLTKFNPENLTIEKISDLNNYTPGDLTFYKGNIIFQDLTTYHIVAFNLENHSLVTIYCLPDNFIKYGHSFYGLANNSDRCESLSIIATSSINDIYEININSNNIRQIHINNPPLDFKTRYFGAASYTENLSSLCSYQFTDVNCPDSHLYQFYVLSKTQEENVFNIHGLENGKLEFLFSFQSEFGCSDIAMSYLGFFYGIGTDSPNTIFKINAVSGRCLKVNQFPTNKTHESLVMNQSGNLYSIDEDGLVYEYDYKCNEINSISIPMGHAPTSDLVVKGQYLIFQSKIDGNIKAFDLNNNELLNIICVEAPYNDTSNGGFVGLANVIEDCESFNLTGFNVQNKMVDLSYEKQSIYDLSIDLSNLNSGETIQGTAYNYCNYFSHDFYFEDILCTSSSKDISYNFINTYPNPTDAFLSISSDLPLVKIKLYDTNGSLVKEFKSDLNKIDLGNCPSGIYFLECITKDNRQVEKIIIK